MTAKPLYRIRSDGSGARLVSEQRPRASAGYLRDTRSAVINTRPAILREHKDEVRLAWRRAAGLAADIIQNSGRIRGAVDQIIADTVGEELVLTPKPNLAKLGYSEKETVEWVRLVKEWWKKRAWNPRECDLRGKFTIPQIVDIALRDDVVFGEAIGVLSFMRAAERRQYRIVSGTKLCLMSPASLVQDTNAFEGLYQGVVHDQNGRPVAYRFEEKNDGIMEKRDRRAMDARGRQMVVHVFEPISATDVRGISRVATGIRKHIQHEILVDATIQTQVLQTIFAAALTSPNPSKEAFEAIEALPDDDNGLRGEILDYFGAAFDKASEGKISISGEPQISHLAPGEDLKLLSTGTPGPQFLPVSAELSRDMARALGITYGGLTMDHTDATYSSVNMDNASIWPIVTRRRSRVAAPLCQAFYESGLDEEIGEGRIPFKGGYEAFDANRDDVFWTLWNGPAKPTADDGKSAKAATERLVNGTTTFEAECAERGLDPEEVFESRKYWHDRFVDAGMPSPFVAKNSGTAVGQADEDEKPVRRKERA